MENLELTASQAVIYFLVYFFWKRGYQNVFQFLLRPVDGDKKKHFISADPPNMVHVGLAAVVCYWQGFCDGFSGESFEYFLDSELFSFGGGRVFTYFLDNVTIVFKINCSDRNMAVQSFFLVHRKTINRNFHMKISDSSTKKHISFLGQHIPLRPVWSLSCF